jgi:hypothetical protein
MYKNLESVLSTIRNEEKYQLSSEENTAHSKKENK